MPLKFQHFGEQAILISWPEIIDHKTSLDIYHYNQKLQALIPEEILETVATYCSLIVYVNHAVDQEKLTIKLKEIYQSNALQQEINPMLWKIPVCYDLSFALDLENLASEKKLSIEQVTELHYMPTYTVDFLGFLPGFPYLSGLNPLLFTPRLSKPREHIDKGSVAIGGKQTGIYPVNSPGGWHIIGRTPKSFFDVSKKPPCFLQPLDKIKFYPISLREFNRD